MKVEIVASTSDRLKEAITLRNIKQSELARITGIDKSSISLYINGRYSPKGDKLYKLASALGVSPAWLSGFNAPMVEMNNELITPSGTVPVYGSIPAGVPALAQQYIDEYILTTVPNPENYFALKVKGTSMINAGIPDGCKVLCLKQNTAENGQIVCCRVNGDEATLKRFKQQDDMVILIPENPQFEPRIVPLSKFESGEAEILGVVKQIIIDL